MTARVELTRTSGVFQLDGGTFEVDNNVWIIGDDHEVLVVDPSHEPDRILAAIGGRRVTAVVCTHGHNDHINAAVPVADAVGAPILLHVDDEVLWKQVYPDRAPDLPLADGDRLPVAALEFTVLHTPGHTWGGICLHEAEQGWLFAGDTLFRGGPGATGRSFSDFPTIVHAISERLLGLDSATIVHTGHGETTTIGAEAPHRDEWLIRGH